MVVATMFYEWDRFPLTLDPNLWYFPWAVATMLAFASFAFFGYFISLGEQRLFSDPLTDG